MLSLNKILMQDQAFSVVVLLNLSATGGGRAPPLTFKKVVSSGLQTVRCIGEDELQLDSDLCFNCFIIFHAVLNCFCFLHFIVGCIRTILVKDGIKILYKNKPINKINK